MKEKYLFKQVNRAKVLGDNTITYLANEKIKISRGYLSDILNGKMACSKVIARRITNSICREASLEDYFENVSDN